MAITSEEDARLAGASKRCTQRWETDGWEDIRWTIDPRELEIDKIQAERCSGKYNCTFHAPLSKLVFNTVFMYNNGNFMNIIYTYRNFSRSK